MIKFISRNLSTIVRKAGPIQNSIEKKIGEKFGPYDLIHCGVNNISWKHNVPRDSETHFEVIVVTAKFESMKLVERHRIINELLNDEIKNKNVSISLTTIVPTRWFNSIKRGLKLEEIYQAPPCLGGRARELMKEEEGEKSRVEKK